MPRKSPKCSEKHRERRYEQCVSKVLKRKQDVKIVTKDLKDRCKSLGVSLTKGKRSIKKTVKELRRECLRMETVRQAEVHPKKTKREKEPRCHRKDKTGPAPVKDTRRHSVKLSQIDSRKPASLSNKRRSRRKNKVRKSTSRSNDWTRSIAEARDCLGISGFHPVRGDTELYILAKELYAKKKSAKS